MPVSVLVIRSVKDLEQEQREQAASSWPLEGDNNHVNDNDHNENTNGHKNINNNDQNSKNNGHSISNNNNDDDGGGRVKTVAEQFPTVAEQFPTVVEQLLSPSPKESDPDDIIEPLIRLELAKLREAAVRWRLGVGDCGDRVEGRERAVGGGQGKRVELRPVEFEKVGTRWIY